MPRISEFFGIVITMYHHEHGPPHFHARYGGDNAMVGIDPVAVIEGQLPRRVLRLVLAWAELHQADLEENWNRASRREPLVNIAPLA